MKNTITDDTNTKCAILTGASGGIGAAITKELVSLDYEVYGFGRDFSKPDSPIESDLFHPIVLDLTDTTALCNTVRSLRKENNISLLINNAGVGYFGLHEELSPSKIHEMITVNLEVPLILSQLLLRDFKQNHGQIINISSVTATKSNPHGCAYGATKAALSSFSKSLFDEARKYGVRVTSIQPDMTVSDFYRNADFTTDFEDDCSLLPADVAQAVHTILTLRSGMVATELTLQPQKHRIRRINP